MDYSIKTYTDLYPTAALLSIWKGNLEGIDSKRIEWFYNGNPQGKAVLLTATDNKTGEEFGCLAAFPREAFYKGSPLRTAISGDFAVKSGWKTLLPALKLQKQLMSRPDFPVIIGFPNRQGYLVQKRAGFNDFGQLARYVKVLKSKGKLVKFLPKFVVAIISPIVDLGLRIFAVKASYFAKRVNAKSAGEIDNPNEDLDKIWQRAKEQFDFILSRPASYINWRFFDHPYQEHELLLFYSSYISTPCGYIVFRMIDEIIEVLDFLWTESTETLKSIICNFEKHCRKIDASTISFQLNESSCLDTVFRSMGYFKRDGDRVVVYCSDKNLENELRKSSKVFISIGDNDI